MTRESPARTPGGGFSPPMRQQKAEGEATCPATCFEPREGDEGDARPLHATVTVEGSISADWSEARPVLALKPWAARGRLPGRVGKGPGSPRGPARLPVLPPRCSQGPECSGLALSRPARPHCALLDAGGIVQHAENSQSVCRESMLAHGPGRLRATREARKNAEAPRTRTAVHILTLLLPGPRISAVKGA